MAKLRVAIIAPPWLALPVKGYGGIELVLEGLISGLRKQGIEMEVFSNGQYKIRGVVTHSYYKKELFDKIHKPYYETIGYINAHIQFSLNKILEDGSFDIIHDHNTLIGPLFFSYASRIKGVPPVLHTFHGPPFDKMQKSLDKPDFHSQLDLIKDMGNMYMVAISDAMTKMAPAKIKTHLLSPVHNAIDLDQFTFSADKKDYYITLARFTPEKGQHVAVKLANKHKKRLRMAGTVNGIGSGRKLLAELSNPLSEHRSNHEFRYYSDKILPHVLNNPRITYAGNLSGQKKMQFLSKAKALLFPIDWEEPFGMAVIEALACGTPVVAMKRGAMPEIIEHGVTGFLAENEKEFEEYMLQVDEINPEDCRKSIESKFSANVMAASYIERYNQVINLAKVRKGI